MVLCMKFYKISRILTIYSMYMQISGLWGKSKWLKKYITVCSCYGNQYIANCASEDSITFNQ